MITVKSTGNLLIDGGIGQKVPSQLPDGKLIERHILIKGFDHPVPPNPLVGVSVLLEAITVGIACSIQPFESHTFTIVWACQ